jgi:flagellar motor switch protein FliG
MFVFEDLASLDAQGMKELLATIDRKVLTVALKGTSDELRNHFMSVMSQRGAEMLRDDIAALGSVKIKEVDAAHSKSFWRRANWRRMAQLVSRIPPPNSTSSKCCV